MFKKALIILFIGISWILSINNVEASTNNPHSDKFDEKTLETLEKYSKDFSKMDITLITKWLINTESSLSVIENSDQKYMLLKNRLRALTGLKVEKIGLFDDWMMTKKVTTLKKVVNLLDDLKVKYQESEKKQNAIYFLKI